MKEVESEKDCLAWFMYSVSTAMSTSSVEETEMKDLRSNSPPPLDLPPVFSVGGLHPRNQRIDLFKCLAIYSVTFLHIKSGVWDQPVTALSRYAVPYFFLASGYFAFGKRPKQLLRQAGRAALMWAGAVGLVLLLCAAMILRHPSWSVWSYIVGQLTPQAAREWLIGQVMPFPYAYHIWYTGALPILYLIWSGIAAIAGSENVPYRHLAVVSCVLLAAHFTLSEGRGMQEEIPVNAIFLRNVWMGGLPFFALGAWMHQDQEAITARLTPGLAIAGVAGGSLLALGEQYWAGVVDLYLGSSIAAVFLLAAVLRWPTVKHPRLTKPLCFCGRELTFLIYAVHVPLHSALFIEWQSSPLFQWGAAHLWTVPWIMAVLSTLAAISFWYLRQAGRMVFRRQRPHLKR